MDPVRPDVIVIGAGAAGLAAADELCTAGLKVTVLEARHRCGGRIDTRHEPNWLLPIERGAEFIHGWATETWDIVRSAQLAVVDTTQRHFFVDGNRPAERDDRWADVESVLKRLDRIGPTDASFADFLQSTCQDLPAKAQAAAASYVEGFNAADRKQISMQWLKQTEEALDAIEGERAFRIVAGYDRIIDRWQSRLARQDAVIHFDTAVTSVHWQPGSVRVDTSSPDGASKAYHARAAIVTLPVGILKLQSGEPGAVRFVPDLPEQRAALAALRMGPVVKLVLRFTSPFWEADCPDLGFLHVPGKTFPTWWTQLPLRATVLTGWAGGPAAEKLSGLADEPMVELGLTMLEDVFPDARPLGRLLAASQVCNWQTDPWSRGAYSYAAVGGAGACRTLAKPVGETLFFAGEATHPGLSGTVAGAIASGQRAAMEVRRSVTSGPGRQFTG
jgi:monoamine oxidase